MAVTVGKVGVLSRPVLSASSAVTVSPNTALLSSHCISSLEILTVVYLTGARGLLPELSPTHGYTSTNNFSSCEASSKAVGLAYVFQVDEEEEEEEGKKIRRGGRTTRTRITSRLYRLRVCLRLWKAALDPISHQALEIQCGDNNSPQESTQKRPNGPFPRHIFLCNSPTDRLVDSAPHLISNTSIDSHLSSP